MANHVASGSRSFAPSEADARLARESNRRLSGGRFGKRGNVRIQILDNEGSESVLLPRTALRALQLVLAEMAQGHAVTLISEQAELTTQQAADVLNVSRPFLVGLLEKGKIPFRKVGKHRRLLFRHVMEYQQNQMNARLKALDKLAAQAQALNMGY